MSLSETQSRAPMDQVPASVLQGLAPEKPPLSPREQNT